MNGVQLSLEVSKALGRSIAAARASSELGGVRGVWKEYRLDVEDAQAVGEKLVVVGRVYARGIESGLELDSGWSAVVSVRDGLAVSAWDWLDRDEAFKAVGVSD